MRQKILFATLLSFCILFNHTIVYSWDTYTTHRTLTVQAHEYLVNNNLIPLEYQGDNIKNNLSDGARDEDNPIFRAWFHFYPAINSAIATATCNSVEWAFNDTPCTGTIPLVDSWTYTNYHTWSYAVDYAGIDAAWIALGHVLHLLEDLAMPAHVRNDPHAQEIGDGDPLELYAKDQTPPLPTGSLYNFDSPDEFFLSLIEYTQANHFSNDTCFHPNFPGPIAVEEDVNYFYAQNDRRIAYKGSAYYAAIYLGWNNPERYSATNHAIVVEQFNDLAPRAALYVASLAKHYVDNYLGPECPCYSSADLVAAVQGNSNSCRYSYWTDHIGYDGFSLELGDSTVDTFGYVADEYTYCSLWIGEICYETRTIARRCNFYILDDEIVEDITLDFEQVSQCQAVLEAAATVLGVTCQ